MFALGNPKHSSSASRGMERNLARVCPENGATSRGKARQCRVQQKRSSRSVARSFTFTQGVIFGAVQAPGSSRKSLRNRFSEVSYVARSDFE